MAQSKVKNSICFLYDKAPASYNTQGAKKVAYKNNLQSAYNRKYKGKLNDTDLYGVIYHFFRKDIDLDADNLSKPVWDSLSTLAFNDDKQIICRTAISVDLNKYDANIIDFTSIPDSILGEFMQKLHDESIEHLMIVEAGEINDMSNIFAVGKL